MGSLQVFAVLRRPNTIHLVSLPSRMWTVPARAERSACCSLSWCMDPCVSQVNRRLNLRCQKHLADQGLWKPLRTVTSTPRVVVASGPVMSCCRVVATTVISVATLLDDEQRNVLCTQLCVRPLPQLSTHVCRVRRDCSGILPDVPCVSVPWCHHNTTMWA